MDCKQYRVLLHQFFDGDIPDEQKEELMDHIQQCEACQQEFEQLQKLEFILKSQEPVSLPTDFTSKVMAQLPKETVTTKETVANKETMTEKLSKWMRRHPMVVAAALFLIIMLGSLLTVGEDGRVYFTSSAHLVEQIEVIDTFMKWLWSQITSIIK